jgi:sulfur transfer protein SufE/uncharacterized protein YbaR (Trm112 family)
MTDINKVQDEIIEEFNILGDDRESTIFYIMEIGNSLDEFPEEAKTEENIIKGCQSKVWLLTSTEEDKVVFHADSNTDITKGLISLLIRVLSGRTPGEIINADLNFIDKIGMGSIIGRDYKMARMFDLIESVADTRTTVMILGENGTGKTITARAIHQLSSRRDKPFVAINCGAIPPDLLESELFGHEKGAFTGALTQRKGRFEMANKGTIFLDEIGEMTFGTQTKLLRILQEREFERIGSNVPIKVDIRVITATNRNLAEQVDKGRFREDLYYRLNVIHIHMPPLRERMEDIPSLVEHFLVKYRYNQYPHGPASKLISPCSPLLLCSNALVALRLYFLMFTNADCLGHRPFATLLSEHPPELSEHLTPRVGLTEANHRVTQIPQAGRLLGILACPVCKSAVEVAASRVEGDHVVEGTLTCTKCGTEYPIEDSIPNLLPVELRP